MQDKLEQKRSSAFEQSIAQGSSPERLAKLTKREEFITYEAYKKTK